MSEIELETLGNKDLIIDIRSKYLYNLNHIPNAQNIPYYSILSNHSIYLDKSNTYYLYCDSGIQSKEVSDRLNLLGYKTFSIKGGYLSFKKKHI